jgi:hypothetical protein
MTIREFHEGDLAEVAGLFCRVFRAKGRANPAAVAGHLRDVYLGHPWPDADSPSLVLEDGGRVRGFFGVLPFPMRFRGAAVRAAVGGNYMVDPDLKDPFAGVRLLKQFLAQPRDLSMTDTSNDTGRKSWESQGGTTLHLYSLQWLRLLRPAGFVLAAAGRVKPMRPLAALARPCGALADAVAARLPKSPFVPVAGDLDARELTPEVLLAGIESLKRQQLLLPDHTPESLAWLLGMARQKREFGPLVGRALYRKDSLVGWYLYYPNPGKWGQVLQLMARPGQVRAVFDHLLADAYARGSVAVMGRVHPQQMSDLAGAKCVFLNRNTYTQIHTRDEELRHAVLRGEAMLTRLEGEWWTRFWNDAFDEAAGEAAPKTPAALAPAGEPPVASAT